MAIAALLHDAVEDQGGEPRLSDIRNRFGDRVADIVRSCSDSVVNTSAGAKYGRQDYVTSGCGTGITFTIPKALEGGTVDQQGKAFSPDAVFHLMDEMAKAAQRYRSHGGMHSAAVGVDSLCLYAEDLGRHNTIDRIAGEALLKGIDLAGMMLVTSGRVSTELVAKAALLGITLIASRTSPTNMAIKMADAAGITLIGYVRAGRFDVYAHPERLQIEHQ